MQTNEVDVHQAQSGKKSIRLNYLDWLRVLAILGVFIFHAVRLIAGAIERDRRQRKRSIVCDQETAI